VGIKRGERRERWKVNKVEENRKGCRKEIESFKQAKGSKTKVE